MIVKLTNFKTQYEIENPGKPFIEYFKEICDEIIEKLDSETVGGLLDTFQEIQKNFIAFDPESKVLNFFYSMGKKECETNVFREIIKN